MISIIIPTYNRSSQLAHTLQSLTALTTPRDRFEIIIIDNGSSDNTEGIANGFICANRDTAIKYFYDPVPGLLTGRHRGALEAKGNILTFIDDDVCVSADWLNSIINVMAEREDISFLTGPNLPLYETDPPKWLDFFWNTAYGGKYCTWLSLLDLSKRVQEIHPNFVWGLNFTVRRTVFIELGGFHPDNIPEQFQKFQGDGETGLTMKGFYNGCKALYHPEILLYHQIPASRLSFEYFDKRAYYQGVCDSYTSLRAGKKNIEKEKTDNYKKRYFNKLKRLILKTIFGTKKKPDKSIPVEIENFLKRLSMKSKEGFNFHQKMYNENANVKDWVHQENYFNYKLPSK